MRFDCARLDRMRTDGNGLNGLNEIRLDDIRLVKSLQTVLSVDVCSVCECAGDGVRHIHG